MKLEKMLASCVANSVNEQMSQESISKAVAKNIKTSIQAEADSIEEIEGDKISYYIGRTCEELANKLKDIRFEANNSFNYGKAVVSNVTTDETGVTKVTVTQPLEVVDTRDVRNEINNLLANLKTIALPKKFADYVTISSKPGMDDMSVELAVVFNLPEEYLEAIGADDFLKRNTIVSKEIKKLVDTYFA